jgi:AbrB family looped-hinge helix DNA binding protein
MWRAAVIIGWRGMGRTLSETYAYVNADIAARTITLYVHGRSYNAKEGGMPVTVSEKGWVVIPAELRKKYNLHAGAQLSVVDYGGVLALVPAMAKPVRQAAGMLKGRTSLTRALLSDHRRERARGR